MLWYYRYLQQVLSLEDGVQYHLVLRLPSDRLIIDLFPSTHNVIRSGNVSLQGRHFLLPFILRSTVLYCKHGGREERTLVVKPLQSPSNVVARLVH